MSTIILSPKMHPKREPPGISKYPTLSHPPNHSRLEMWGAEHLTKRQPTYRLSKILWPVVVGRKVGWGKGLHLLRISDQGSGNTEDKRKFWELSSSRRPAVAIMALNKSASLQTREKGRGARTWPPQLQRHTGNSLVFCFPVPMSIAPPVKCFLSLDFHGTYSVLFNKSVSWTSVSESLLFANWRAPRESTRHYFRTKIMTHFQDAICTPLC